MENEIELKIMLAEQNVALLKNWLSEQKVLSHSIDQLGNTYFDTPEQFFARQQMGLRVRTQNGNYEMTLKTKGEITGGLHIRPEYNLPLETATPDFKRLVSHFNLQIEQVDEIQTQLVPTFSTDFTRHKWLLAVNQSHIEVALDQGLIKNQYGQTEICEAEFELKTGSIADIFTLLEQMPKADGMWFSGLSKAQRGYLIGQADKFEREITTAIAEKQGYELEQLLADYIREMPGNAKVLAVFQQLNRDFGKLNWQALQQKLRSSSYLADNLQRLQKLIALHS